MSYNMCICTVLLSTDTELMKIDTMCEMFLFLFVVAYNSSI